MEEVINFLDPVFIRELVRRERRPFYNIRSWLNNSIQQAVPVYLTHLSTMQQKKFGTLVTIVALVSA
jgi:hypothetical protein